MSAPALPGPCAENAQTEAADGGARQEEEARSLETLLSILTLLCSTPYRQELAPALAASKSVHDALLPLIVNAPIPVRHSGRWGSLQMPYTRTAATRLWIASVTGNVPRVKQLLAAGADPCGVPDSMPKCGRAPAAGKPVDPTHCCFESAREANHGLLHRVAETIEMRQLQPQVACEVFQLLFERGSCIGGLPGHVRRLLVVLARVAPHTLTLLHKLLDDTQPAWRLYMKPLLTEERASAIPMYVLYHIRGVDATAASVCRPISPSEAALLAWVRLYTERGGLCTVSDSPSDNALYVVLKAIAAVDTRDVSSAPTADRSLYDELVILACEMIRAAPALDLVQSMAAGHYGRMCMLAEALGTRDERIIPQMLQATGLVDACSAARRLGDVVGAAGPTGEASGGEQVDTSSPGGTCAAHTGAVPRSMEDLASEDYKRLIIAAQTNPHVISVLPRGFMRPHNNNELVHPPIFTTLAQAASELGLATWIVQALQQRTI